MPTYPDRRSRYAGVFPWDCAKVVSTVPAHRGPAPGDNFRVVTADPPEPAETEWVQNERGEWVKEPLAVDKSLSHTEKTQPDVEKSGQSPLTGSVPDPSGNTVESVDTP